MVSVSGLIRGLAVGIDCDEGIPPEIAEGFGVLLKSHLFKISIVMSNRVMSEGHYKAQIILAKYALKAPDLPPYLM